LIDGLESLQQHSFALDTPGAAFFEKSAHFTAQATDYDEYTCHNDTRPFGFNEPADYAGDFFPQEAYEN